MSAVAVFDPQAMELERWSTLVAAAIQEFGAVAHSTTVRDWKAWAQQVRALPAIAALNIPDPRSFDNWRLWALRLNEGLAQL